MTSPSLISVIVKLVLTALPRLESARLQKRSDLAVAPATGYLPAEEEYEDLPGYSPDTFSLPGYGDDDLTRQAPGVEEEEEVVVSTTVGLETTTLSGGLEETTTIADGFYTLYKLLTLHINSSI